MKTRKCQRQGSIAPAAWVLSASLLAAVPTQAAAQTATTGRSAVQVTFARDVAPLFQQKCEVCHRPGNIGPMPLTSYEEVRPWVRSIRARVASREMPPWHLDKTVGIQRFINDVSLSDAQIDTIVGWIDAGAPMGNPGDLPARKTWPSDDRFKLEETLGPPDLIVRSKPWTMPAVGQDVHFRPVVDPGLSQPRWIRAIETKPSLKGHRIAHHVTTYIHRRDSADVIAAERALRSGQAGVEAVLAARERTADQVDVREMFSEWAQGKGGEVYPENTGKLVRPGDKIEFETHYHAVGEDITDTMETAWWFYPTDAAPKYSAEFVPIGTNIGQGLEIPPHTVTQHQGSYTLPAPAIIHNFQPHMHMRGKAFLMEALHPDGRREILNYADRYDNRWHVNYIYAPDAAPVLPKGTVVQITAWHDNTSANRNNPDPRQWVTKGGRTVDEMAHANTQVIFITEDEFKRMIEERGRGRTGGPGGTGRSGGLSKAGAGSTLDRGALVR